MYIKALFSVTGKRGKMLISKAVEQACLEAPDLQQETWSAIVPQF